MEITLKNFELLNMQEVFNTLAGQELKDIKVAYRITKVLRKFGPHVEDFQKTRQSLVDKYAKKDEKGEYIPSLDENGKPVTNSIQLEDPTAFNKDLTDLVNEEVKMNLGVTITIDDLHSAGAKLTIPQLAALEKLLDAEGVN